MSKTSPDFTVDKKKKSLRTVYLTEELHAQVQAIAKKNKITVNKAYVSLIEFGVNTTLNEE